MVDDKKYHVTDRPDDPHTNLSDGHDDSAVSIKRKAAITGLDELHNDQKLAELDKSVAALWAKGIVSKSDLIKELNHTLNDTEIQRIEKDIRELKKSESKEIVHELAMLDKKRSPEELARDLMSNKPGSIEEHQRRAWLNHRAEELGLKLQSSFIKVEKHHESHPEVSLKSEGTKVEQKNEWTILVNLGTNIENTSGGVPGGSGDYALKLKALKLESKDKPVTILVQAIHPTSNGFVLERYRIHNGQIDALHSPGSQNTLADLTDFMRSALTANPANKIGLINFAHGLGNLGIVGDHGSATLKDFVKSIQDGLNQSGHNKLDFFDLDSCLMAQTGATEEFKVIAQDVVASAGLEFSRNIQGSKGWAYDAQNINVSLHKLLANPHMNGNQLSEECIRLATAGKNAVGQPTFDTDGTPTLTHLNINKLAQFNDALSIFAKDLMITIEQPDNKDRIKSIIQRTYLYGQSDDTPARDLAEFVMLVKNEIKAGTISDPNNNLLKDVQILTAAQHNLVQSYHSDCVDSVGALSIALPSVQFFDRDRTNDPYKLSLFDARRNTSIGKLSDCAENLLDDIMKEEEPDSKKVSDDRIASTAVKIRALWKRLNPSDQAELDDLNTEMKKLDEDSSASNMREILPHLFCYSTDAMWHSPVNRRLANRLMSDPMSNKSFQEETQPELEVWQQFLVKLYA